MRGKNLCKCKCVLGRVRKKYGAVKEALGGAIVCFTRKTVKQVLKNLGLGTYIRFLCYKVGRMCVRSWCFQTCNRYPRVYVAFALICRYPHFPAVIGFPFSLWWFKGRTIGVFSKQEGFVDLELCFIELAWFLQNCLFCPGWGFGWSGEWKQPLSSFGFSST